MKVPIIILTRDRPVQFRDMIDRLIAVTDPNAYFLIICDNGSTQPDMVAYLESLEAKHVVLYNEANLLFEGFNDALKIVKNGDFPYFCLSDPDILLNKGTPKNWLEQLKMVLDMTSTPKAGLALSIDFAQNNEFTKRVQAGEAVYWTRKADMPFLDDPCYYAMIDTSMAMYRRDTYAFWGPDMLFDRAHGLGKEGWISNEQYNPKYPGLPIRVAGRFTAEHMGWYNDERWMKDLKWYMRWANMTTSSTLFNNWVFLKHEYLPKGLKL